MPIHEVIRTFKTARPSWRRQITSYKMYYQAGTVSNEFCILFILVTREYMTIDEKNNLFERRRRDLIYVGEGHFVTYHFILLPNPIIITTFIS